MKVRILLPTSFPREWERARGISTSSVPDAAGVPAVRMLSPSYFLLHLTASIQRGRHLISTFVASNFKGLYVVDLSFGAIHGGAVDE